MMRLHEYIRLPFEDKVEVLLEEGEFIDSLSSTKDIYSLYDFYVTATTGAEEEIVYVYATNTMETDAY